MLSIDHAIVTLCITYYTQCQCNSSVMPDPVVCQHVTRSQSQMRFGSSPKLVSVPDPNQFRSQTQMSFGPRSKIDSVRVPNAIWSQTEMRFSPGPKYHLVPDQNVIWSLIRIKLGILCNLVLHPNAIQSET